MTARALTAILILAVSGAAACGGDGGIDPEDPEAVAEALARASFACGEDGAGVIYDLILPAQRAPATRDAALSEQRREGCVPKPIPDDLHVALTTRRGDFREYRFTPTTDDAAPGVAPYLDEGSIPLVETDGEWRYVPRGDT